MRMGGRGRLHDRRAGENLTELFNMGVARTAGSARPGIYYNKQVNFVGRRGGHRGFKEVKSGGGGG